MSNETKLIALLKANLSVPVYNDLVPESVNEGVAISNVANPFGRLLNGDKTQRSGIWRVTVVASTKARRDFIITELENLDNTSDNDFQRIYVDLINKEAKESEEQPVVRAFVDITLYPR